MTSGHHSDGLMTSSEWLQYACWTAYGWWLDALNCVMWHDILRWEPSTRIGVYRSWSSLRRVQGLQFSYPWRCPRSVIALLCDTISFVGSRRPVSVCIGVGRHCVEFGRRSVVFYSSWCPMERTWLRSLSKLVVAASSSEGLQFSYSRWCPMERK